MNEWPIHAFNFSLGPSPRDNHHHHHHHHLHKTLQSKLANECFVLKEINPRVFDSRQFQDRVLGSNLKLLVSQFWNFLNIQKFSENPLKLKFSHWKSRNFLKIHWNSNLAISENPLKIQVVFELSWLQNSLKFQDMFKTTFFK